MRNNSDSTRQQNYKYKTVQNPPTDCFIDELFYYFYNASSFSQDQTFTNSLRA
jgi:hypothetical protein